MNSKLLTSICLLLSILSILLSSYSIFLSNNKSVSTGNSINTSIINETNKKALVGTYRGKWNNNENTIIELFPDSTMINFNGERGIWYIENGEVVLEYEYTSSFWDDKVIRDDAGNPKEETRTVQNRATILEKGLLLGTTFYAKL